MTLESLTPRIAYKMQNTSLYKGGGGKKTAPLTVSPQKKGYHSYKLQMLHGYTNGAPPPPPPPAPKTR